MSIEEEQNKKESERIRCAECGTILKESDIECPNCGSTKKTSGPIHFTKVAKVAIGIRTMASAVHEIRMTGDSWTVLGLILGFIIPPLFFGIFSMLTICFWYKLIIWLSITIIAFLLTKSYTLIIILKFIADKAYGKRKM